MKPESLKSIVNRRYVKTNGSHSMVQKEKLGDIMQSALEQSLGYCSALLEGGINPVKNKNIKLYYTAITGIGTRVINQQLVYYRK